MGPALELSDDLPMPFGRAEAVVIEVDEEGNPVLDASTRSATCVKTLCIQRHTPSPASGEGKFYVYHRDADNTGWSALLTEIDWYADLPGFGWASFTLYDEQSLPICIDDNDVVFVMEHPGAGISPFGIRLTICTNGQADESIATNFAIGGSNYTWGRFVPDTSKTVFCTQSSDNSACNNIDFSAIGDGSGTVRFLSPKSGTYVDLPVPSKDVNLTWPGSPLIGIWHNNSHHTVRGTGGYTRNCTNTNNDYEIGGSSGWHGVILNRWERWCYLHY
jgi:hypothetical protein